jgi:hypothetical protein
MLDAGNAKFMPTRTFAKDEIFHFVGGTKANGATSC